MEFMQKRMQEDLIELERTQLEHAKNQESFNKKIQEVDTQATKLQKMRSWLNLNSKHKALEKRLRNFLIEERLNDYKEGSNSTVTQQQLDLLQ